MCFPVLDQMTYCSQSFGYAETVYIVGISCIIMMLYLKFSSSCTNITTDAGARARRHAACAEEREIWNSAMRYSIERMSLRINPDDEENGMYILLMNMARAKIDDNAPQESILRVINPVHLFIQAKNGGSAAKDAML